MNAIRPPGPQTDEAATLAGEAASESETQEILPLDNSGDEAGEQARIDEFDWSRDEADVVIREQPRTVIYRNKWGAIVIRQLAQWPDEDDPYVWIDAKHLGNLIARLKELEAEAWQ